MWCSESGLFKKGCNCSIFETGRKTAVAKKRFANSEINLAKTVAHDLIKDDGTKSTDEGFGVRDGRIIEFTHCITIWPYERFHWVKQSSSSCFFHLVHLRIIPLLSNTCLPCFTAFHCLEVRTRVQLPSFQQQCHITSGVTWSFIHSLL